MSEIREDEGFIDVRFVLGRNSDTDAVPEIYRLERMGYLLPDGTTEGHINQLIDDCMDEPLAFTYDVCGIFKWLFVPTESNAS